MSNPTIIRVGPDLFTRIAVDSRDLRRVLNARHSIKSEDRSFNAEPYAVLCDNELMGAMSLVEFPDFPDVCIIDFLSIADGAPPETRELLLGKALECPTVIALASAVPSLVANPDFTLRSDAFVHSEKYFTDEELISLCQTYQSRVSSSIPIDGTD